MELQLFIVNGFDKPCERLIAEKREDGKLYYIHPEMQREWADKGMSADEATPLADFGLTILIEDGEVTGAQSSKSFAHYEDGRIRPWQGQSYFSFDLPTNEPTPDAYHFEVKAAVTIWAASEQEAREQLAGCCLDEDVEIGDGHLYLPSEALEEAILTGVDNQDPP